MGYAVRGRSGVALCGAFLCVFAAAACSGSSPSAQHSSTASSASSNGSGSSDSRPAPALAHGINVLMDPGDQSVAPAVPPGLDGCVAKRLSSLVAKRVKAVTSHGSVPDAVAVPVLQAAARCDPSFLASEFQAGLTKGAEALPGLTSAQVGCAAPKIVAGIIALGSVSNTSDSSGTVLSSVVAKSLDPCASPWPYLLALVREMHPTVTDGQLACLQSKSPPLTWETALGDVADPGEQALAPAFASCRITSA